MTLTHDPDFPQVLTDNSGKPYAKFSDRDLAQQYYNFLAVDGNLVDTTPSRIPEDAQTIIVWVYSDYQDEPQPYFYRRYGHPGNKVWQTSGGARFVQAAIEENAKDREITVIETRGAE